MKTTITSIRARQIWDSRGRPTVEAEVALSCGSEGRAAAQIRSEHAVKVYDVGTLTYNITFAATIVYP